MGNIEKMMNKKFSKKKVTLGNQAVSKIKS